VLLDSRIADLEAGSMDSGEEIELSQLQTLSQVFRDQLLACLEECVQGRAGLFANREHLGDGEEQGWPEAARLRELAIALQALFAQQDEPNPLCDEFLDLCSIHGESNPGERRLARAFLARIEKGQVGTPTQEERKIW
jgi:hypothetical protein